MTLTTQTLARKNVPGRKVTAPVVRREIEQIRTWETIRKETVLRTGIERHNLIQKGLPTSTLVVVLGTFDQVPQTKLLHAIGLSTKTLGRKGGTFLGPRHSDAAMALIEVTDTAHRVLGNRELAERWLAQPALALDGQSPLDLLTTTPGIEAVKDLLTRMEYGVYA